MRFAFTRIAVSLAVLVLGVVPQAGARTGTPQWDDVSAVSCATPPPRKHHTFVVDAGLHEGVLWGGEKSEALWAADTVWTFDLPTLQWAAHHTTSPDTTTPPAMHGHIAVCIPEQHKMVVLMGATVTASGNLVTQGTSVTPADSLWELDLTNYQWTRKHISGSTPCRRWHSALSVLTSGSTSATLVMMGGFSNESSPTSSPWAISDTWRLLQSGGSWSWVHDANSCDPFASPGDPDNHPDRRFKHALVNADNNHLFVHGGTYQDEAGVNNDYCGTYGTSVSWGSTSCVDATSTNYARAEYASIYDPVDHRMIIADGWIVNMDNAFGNQDPTNLVDYIGIDHTTGAPGSWAALSTTGTAPSKRKGNAAIYDSARDRMVIFGGVCVDTFYNDTKTLSFNGGPIAAAISDLAISTHNNSTATLTWSFPISQSGGLASYEVRASSSPITTDAEFNSATTVSATVSQSGSGPYTLTTTITSPSPTSIRYFAVRATQGCKALGPSNNVCFKQTPWVECTGGGESARPADPEGGVMPLAIAFSNPIRGTGDINFSTRGRGPVALEVMDVAGRRVERHSWAMGRAGSQTLRLGAERALAPGYYLVVLREGEDVVRRPLIVVR